MEEITLQDLYQARQRIAGMVLRTPLVPAASLASDTREVRLKLETLQPTGAFKVRGAANAAARLSPEGRAAGVVCASTGNHGRALALAARRAGVQAHVCLSNLVPANKVEAIRALGAKVHVAGQSQDDAQLEVERLAAEHGMVEIPPFDHPDVIAGQGTIGLELLEDFPEMDTVVVPVSGGGLVGGIALAVKHANPAIRVIGLSMAEGAAMHASLDAGHPVQVREVPSLADSLGGGIGLENRYTLELARRYLDQLLLLSEARIAAAMRHLFLHEGIVTEGAAAVGIAPLLEDLGADMGRHVAVVVSGRNVDMNRFLQLVQGSANPEDHA